MTDHPYRLQPNRAFWSKSVTSNFDTQSLLNQQSKLIGEGDKVTSAGSCFASNMIPHLESVGITYIRTEKVPNVLSNLGENLGYANFSASYGNVYTARQLKQLYQRALGDFSPSEYFWTDGKHYIDPFRPGLKFPAESKSEFDFLLENHLRSTRLAFESADVFVFTLGLTESWVNKVDGAVYPACPGTISGSFNPSKHSFKNFSVGEIVEDLKYFINLLREKNPKIRFILTVSPVPLVATATNNHVLVASTYSKSVLRVAAQNICDELKDVVYFPAYEIITGPQAPNDYFESDKRNVSKLGVEVVMKALLETSGLTTGMKKNLFKKQDSTNLLNLSSQISTAECDEVMLDPNLN